MLQFETFYVHLCNRNHYPLRWYWHYPPTSLLISSDPRSWTWPIMPIQSSSIFAGSAIEQFCQAALLRVEDKMIDIPSTRRAYYSTVSCPSLAASKCWFRWKLYLCWHSTVCTERLGFWASLPKYIVNQVWQSLISRDSPSHMHWSCWRQICLVWRHGCGLSRDCAHEFEGYLKIQNQTIPCVDLCIQWCRMSVC